MHDLSRPEPSALLALAESAARQAGRLLLEGQRSGATGVRAKTTRTDLVSDLDRASEKLIVDFLLSARPDDSLLGEEGSERSGTSAVRWVVDPLDGTVNFLYGLAPFAVSIAAEVDGAVVAGVVHDPSRDETFTAVRHAGSHLNGRRLGASTVSELDLALVGTGFAYDAATRARQGRIVARLLPRVRDIRRAGSAALDLCSVAAGRLDGYFESGTRPWDRAAGELVAIEAGAVVCGPGGGPATDELVVAAGPALIGRLQEALAAPA